MGIKLALGEVSGSLALRADAMHSLADVISSLTIFLGIVISGRRTRTFPEGLYKVENLVALISSLFILAAAYGIGREAVVGETLGPLRNLPVVLAGIAVIMVAAWLFSRYELRVGLQVGSPSLVADARHVTTDLLSTTVILASVLGHVVGLHLDRYVAIIVALLVARMGIEILVDSLKVLLDATLDFATLDGVRDVLESHPDVTEVVSLGGRRSGRFRFVEAVVVLDARLLRDAHDIISSLEEQILDRWPDLDRILIHYQPEQKEALVVAVPLELPAGEELGGDAALSEHFGEAPSFALITVHRQSGEVSLRTRLANPHLALTRHKGVRVAEWLAAEGVDEVQTRTDLAGRGSGYALEALQVQQRLTNATTLDAVLRELTGIFGSA
jgi:cation diffusion facilitator family transporter